jgi:tetratricopeptide (TPR) repeat protein
MKHGYLLIILFFIFFNSSVYSAGTSSNNNEGSKIDNYKTASNLIKQAKKYETKGKSEKAKKKFVKALEYLLMANKAKPNDPDTLNYLGFTSRKIGNLKVAEEYYLEGLSLDPNHFGINEYLGELYVNTNRIDEAKKRLEVLKNCNCEEFNELNNVIKTGTSKY